MNPIDAIQHGQFAMKSRVDQRRISPYRVAIKRRSSLLYQIPRSHILRKYLNRFNSRRNCHDCHRHDVIDEWFLFKLKSGVVVSCFSHKKEHQLQTNITFAKNTWDLPDKALLAPLDNLINRRVVGRWWICRNLSVRSSRNQTSNGIPAYSPASYSDN